MKEIQVKNKTYLFVEIPFDAKYNFGISDNNIAIGDSNDSANWVKFEIQLPKEDRFRIISTTKDITEEQAESIVERLDNENSFKDYELEFTKDCEYILATAKESLQSLIQANGLDVNKNYLILQKL
jgi:hypothetical protein